MSKSEAPWPHAPKHQLSQNGTYFVTAGTYLKVHHFRTPQRLEVLQRGLLAVTRDFRWELEAWAIFSNHYHFIAHTQDDSASANSLSQMLGVLHARTAGWINRQDVWTKGLAQLLGYQAYLSQILSRAIKVCASERGKAWAGACSEPIPLVFGEMV
jgi:REP element-mobilizing transposase RayT